MLDSFKTISLSHLKAPVTVREQLHLGPDLAKTFPAQLHEILGLREVLVLSTCNRTEVYYLSEDYSKKIIKLLCLAKGIADGKELFPYFQIINDHGQAVRNLFEVSMGLQSKVTGDLQISNQIKQAYSISAEAKLAGPFLHRLLHTIFHTNKRVQQETAFRDGAASVSYAASELARELLSFHSAPTALVIGLGEMGVDVARHLAQTGFTKLGLCNRSIEKAEALQKEIEGEIIPYDELLPALHNYDVIITAIAPQEYIIRPENLEKKIGIGQKFLFDLSVPRAIDPEVANLPGVLHFDIDEINSRTDKVLAKRMAAVPNVNHIIDQEISQFNAWAKEFTISPTINKLKEALEQIRKEELARYLKNAHSEAVILLEKATKSMMNKILKLPVLNLKAACKRGDEENLIGVLNDLFNLEGQEKKEKA